MQFVNLSDDLMFGSRSNFTSTQGRVDAGLGDKFLLEVLKLRS